MNKHEEIQKQSHPSSQKALDKNEILIEKIKNIKANKHSAQTKPGSHQTCNKKKHISIMLSVEHLTCNSEPVQIIS